jgi:hypothetical protein
MADHDTETIARRAFADIAAQFPQLRMVEDEGVPVEISITLPAQPGLKQKVWLALQNNDELHFSVGNFWLGWFPCTEPKSVKSYIDSVAGFLSGKYRILEHYRGTKCVKAELQKHDAVGWNTIGTWSILWFPLPWKKEFKEVRNA